MIKEYLSYNEWESKFFGYSIFSLNPCQVNVLTNINTADFAEKSLITCKADSNNYLLLDYLSENDFSLIEGDVSLECQLCESRLLPELSKDSFATLSDLDRLYSIVDNSYPFSRFREPFFSVNEKNRFYREWIRNAVLGCFDDYCLVLRDEGIVIGFVSIKERDNKAIIGLVAVDENYRGQKLGLKLMDLVQAYASRHNLTSISVATQISNKPALRLYFSSGYSLSNISYWFYRKV
ncbi:GNAT family N-acetyltransferase [Endozoicomonas sp. G2_1]|uniref:GNAT family N-acetyltransferase n=1 Tax=Endozoicomonas sp. G2_1 TaxID=2821091 RepID=UPI001ADC9EAF|nr:GNAT family N-acetyltransferase [Endozoicomonas sp. G2_1]MBO9488993.1 GNAT family N-acetyltransferase [Endozoicomonas sp. G2_1]